MEDTTVVSFIIVSMVILLIISLSVLWFLYHTQNRIMKIKMKEQSNKIEYHKNLLLNTIRTQENERKRISAELHDDVASKLNVIHLNVHLLKKMLLNNPDSSKILDQIETSLNESISRTRVISHELMPHLLKKFGFQYALHELAQSINSTGSILVTVRDDHFCQLNDDLNQLHLFRIIQELISNTLKYAHARKIEIVFDQSDSENEIIMNYIDDGVGFDPEKVSSGLGLYNIKTRTELLKGEWKFIHPKDSKGIHFILKFPKDA